MKTLEQSDVENLIREDDLSPIVSILYHSLSINRIYKRESVIEYKEGITELLIELLTKMLSENPSMSKQDKISTINFLDKLKTQREHIEMMRSNISQSDLIQASKRLGKKSQSAFSE